MYVETETESNVVFYENFGFRVVKQITLPLVESPRRAMGASFRLVRVEGKLKRCAE